MDGIARRGGARRTAASERSGSHHRPRPTEAATLACLLLVVALLIPLDRPLLGLPVPARLVLGGAAAVAWLVLLRWESPARRRLWAALGVPVAILALAPIDTRLDTGHILVLGSAFAAVLVVPPLILRGTGVITFQLLPRRLDRVDVLYTLSSIPLAWAAFALYFGVLSPEVPSNWTLPAQQDDVELLKLFLGINGVGIWDELFFVNICFAVLRALFPYRVANPAQAVIYTAVLYDMAFSGWGPLFVYVLALTQGAMFERSRVLLWVLMVHLIVDYWLFQAIVTFYYPDLSVWWHP